MRIPLYSAAIAALVFGLSGAATADPNPNSQTTGNPGKGNQNCELVQPGPAGNPYKNPGKMFQDLRADRDQNPAEVAEDSGFENVGDLIDQKCGVAPD